MTELNQLDMTVFQVYENMDFETFKSLHIDFYDNPASDYYGAMKLQAEEKGLVNIANYARLARGVVDNNTANGMLANNFTEIAADRSNVSFSENSDQRLYMQFKLMKEDIAARQVEIAEGRSGELDFMQTIEIHRVPLDDLGIGIEGFSLYVPLTHIAKSDPTKAQGYFVKTLADEGALDVLFDGGRLGYGMTVRADQPAALIAEDYYNQAEWASISTDALQRFIENYEEATGLDLSPLNGRIEILQQIFIEAPGYLLGGVTHLANKFADAETNPNVVTENTDNARLTHDADENTNLIGTNKAFIEYGDFGAKTTLIDDDLNVSHLYTDSDGRSYFSSSETGTLVAFNMIHELEIPVRLEVIAFLNEAAAKGGPALQEVFAQFPQYASALPSATLNFLAGSAAGFIDVKGLADGATDETDVTPKTVVDETEIAHADGLDGTEGGGPRTETFGLRGNDYSNQDLLFLMRNGAADARFKALGDLYNRAIDQGDISSFEGIVTAQVNGAGFFQLQTDVQGNQIIRFFAEGADPSTDSALAEISNRTDGIQNVLIAPGDDSNGILATLTANTDIEKLALTRVEIADSYYESVLSVASGSVVGFLADKLADGNAVEELLYNAVLKSMAQNFSTLAGMLNDGLTFDQAKVVFTGGEVVTPDNTVVTNESIARDTLVEFVSLAEYAVAGFIVDEVVEAIDIGGIGGEIITAVGNEVTVQLVSETFDVVFNGIDTTLFDGEFFKGGIFGDNGIQFDPVSFIANFAARKLAGELVAPESEVAAIMGSVGGAVAGAIAAEKILTEYAINSVFKALSLTGGPIGFAVSTFIGTVAGTLIGNMFGGVDEPYAESYIAYDRDEGSYDIHYSSSDDGGDAAVAEAMAKAVANGVNYILEAAGGGLRTGAVPVKVAIGYDGDKQFVKDSRGNVEYFERSGEAIEHAALQMLKGYDLVGCHAIVQRAWHNSEAKTLAAFKDDIDVAEAFQIYLMNPTSILALMMDQPESEAALSWAAILQRAAELELHLPHERDFDGGWGELLRVRGDINPEAVPELDGDTIILTDPETGEETVLHHVIGPGYEIVRIEGEDGNDIIEVNVDGPSIAYIDAGAGDDVFIGHDGVDIFVGGDGDDTAHGGDGNDWLIGNDGDDVLFGDAGDDLLVGGDGDDELFGGEGIDQIYGGKGNDTLHGDAGTDYVYGGDGDDILYAHDMQSQSKLYGGAGNDTIIGDSSRASFYGGKGNDTFDLGGNNIVYITRDEGHDIIVPETDQYDVLIFTTYLSVQELWFQQSGDDLKILVLGEDQSVTITDWWSSSYVRERLDIRAASNSLEFKASPQDILDIYGGDREQPQGQYNVVSDAAFDGITWLDLWEHHNTNPKLTTIEEVYGNIITPLDDGLTIGNKQSSEFYASTQNQLAYHFVYAGAGQDHVEGGVSHDQLFGDSGNDYINGLSGSDIIFGGLGRDELKGFHGQDELWGGHGNDIIEGHLGDDISYGGHGDDEIWDYGGDDISYGGDGNDIIRITTRAGVTQDGVMTRNQAYGEDGDDTITAETGHNTLSGGNGIDTIIAAFGNDVISGGAGDDILDSGDGDDTVSGDEGNDTITLGAGNNAASGGDGNDTFYVRDGADSIDGNDGYDIVDYSAGSAVTIDLHNNVFSGGFAEGDVLYSIEEIRGSDSSSGADRDYLYGDAQDNVLKGMAGNDFLEGGMGADTLDGGAGWDYARYTRSDAGVNINLETGVHTGGHAAGDTLISIEAIVGSDHDDTFIGASSNDYFKGGAGNDIINPGLGYDKSYGDAGDDTFIYTGGSEYIYETTGNDRVEFDAVWSPEDLVIDGNTFIFGSTSNQITFDDVSKYEVFKFDGHADMSLTDLQVYLAAQGVTYTGDANDNTFTGTSATETFDGLGGIDTVDYSASTVGNKVDLQAGVGTEGDAAGDEYLSIENIVGSDASSKRDWIWGDAQDNAISGMAGDDILEGGAGADTIDGGAGWDYSRYTRSDAAVNINLETGVNTGGHAEGDILSNIEAIVGTSYGDTIRGGNSNDYLKGENGDDLLIGGNGIDQLYGGNGADTFLFESATAFNHVDQLRDFDLSEGDILNIADLLSGYDAVTDAITDFVQITDNGTNSTLSIDADGGADNFVTIASLYGATGLTDEEALETSGNLVTV